MDAANPEQHFSGPHNFCVEVWKRSLRTRTDFSVCKPNPILATRTPRQEVPLRCTCKPPRRTEKTRNPSHLIREQKLCSGRKLRHHDSEQAAARNAKLHPETRLVNRPAREVFEIDSRAAQLVHYLWVESRVFHPVRLYLSLSRLLHQFMEHLVDVVKSILQTIHWTSNVLRWTCRAISHFLRTFGQTGNGNIDGVQMVLSSLVGDLKQRDRIQHSRSAVLCAAPTR